MVLIEEQSYWVLTDSSYGLCINESVFMNLKLLKLSHSISRMDDGPKYFFHNDEEPDNYTVISGYDKSSTIFKSIDHYLIKMSRFINAMNEIYREDRDHKYYFDDFMKEKIKESQERNPELWI